MSQSKKKGVSPYISVLLLTVVTIAGGIVFYSFSTNIASSINEAPSFTSNTISIDSTRIKENTLTAYIRNHGEKPITIETGYINKKPITGNGYNMEINNPGPSDDKIPGKGTASVHIQIPDGFIPGVSYNVKIISNNNLKLEFTESTYDPQEPIIPSVYTWLGTGVDGDISVNSGDQVVNKYTFLTNDADAGEFILDVDNAGEFMVGDEILVIQIQNSTDGKAGLYEFCQIISINGDMIEVETELDNELSFFSV